jgi:D-cysteine desulfhydrase
MGIESDTLLPDELHVAPLQHWQRLGAKLGIDLYVQRDDLLPFPLAGNKVRKIIADLKSLPALPDVLITCGGIDSNHCRTAAWIAALCGFRSHLVLHSEGRAISPASRAFRLLESLGATYEVVSPEAIHDTLESAAERFRAGGLTTYIQTGGCHTPAGARAYRDTGVPVFDELRPDTVFVASGTGATQGGLVAAAQASVAHPRVYGVSVARRSDRGIPPIREAALWAGAIDPVIDFDDSYIAGGYAHNGPDTEAAVELGWRYGLPLDGTYTGKAFAGLIEQARVGLLDGQRVLFWMTGGLWNSMEQLG